MDKSVNEFVLRPGRTLDVDIVVGPGRWTVRVDADTAVVVGVGDETGGSPGYARTLEGYAPKKSKRPLRIQNVSRKSKARGIYEVSGG